MAIFILDNVLDQDDRVSDQPGKIAMIATALVTAAALFRTSRDGCWLDCGDIMSITEITYCDLYVLRLENYTPLVVLLLLHR